MKKWILLALTVFFVLIGMNFLTPSTQEAVGKPSIRFVAHATTPAPVDYLSSTFAQDSRSTVRNLSSVFQNISDKPVTALQVKWTIHDQSGNKISVTEIRDALPFGDEDSIAGEPFLPGSTIELANHATIATPAAIERIDVNLDFVETPGERKPGIEWPAYGNVWPSQNRSWLSMNSKRNLVATFRSFLVLEVDSKGPGRIEEILQLERERRARMIGQICNDCGLSGTPKLGPAEGDF